MNKDQSINQNSFEANTKKVRKKLCAAEWLTPNNNDGA